MMNSSKNTTWAFPCFYIWPNDTDRNLTAPDGTIVPPNMQARIIDHGMSLHDYFAAKAMQALIQAPINEWPEELRGKSVATAAYEQADHMLKVRES